MKKWKWVSDIRSSDQAFVNDKEEICNTSVPASENPNYFVPEISRTLGARAWKQVVKDWDEQDLTRAHHVPLKDWDLAWHRSTGESVKFGQRRRIALEFIER